MRSPTARVEALERALEPQEDKRCYTLEQLLCAARGERPIGPPEGARRPGEPTLEELLLAARDRAGASLPVKQ